MLCKELKAKVQMWYFIQQALRTDKVKLMGWLWGGVQWLWVVYSGYGGVQWLWGVYSGWGSFFLKYGGEVFLKKCVL